MTEPKGRPDWQPYTVTAAMAEAQEGAVREKTVDQMRAYAEMVAKLDEYGNWWSGHVRDSLAAGMTVDEIAADWQIDVCDVHAALYGREIWPLHDAGVPCVAIAKRLGISPEIVASILGPGSDFGHGQREA